MCFDCTQQTAHQECTPDQKRERTRMHMQQTGNEIASIQHLKQLALSGSNMSIRHCMYLHSPVRLLVSFKGILTPELSTGFSSFAAFGARSCSCSSSSSSLYGSSLCFGTISDGNSPSCRLEATVNSKEGKGRCSIWYAAAMLARTNKAGEDSVDMLVWSTSLVLRTQAYLWQQRTVRCCSQLTPATA